MSLPPLIFEEFECEQAPPEMMDAALAQGWRHFGTKFFRYSLQSVREQWHTVLPLRIQLADFVLSKSQRRILKRNLDLLSSIAPTVVTAEISEMFQRHKERFSENVPEALHDFLGVEPSTKPCQGMALQCRLENELVASSFMDIGKAAISSIYGVFEPEYSKRSLGIFTMLLEIEFAKRVGMKFYYPGYATSGESHYDYKKKFSALQGFDWREERWRPIGEFLEEADLSVKNPDEWPI
jgi:arginine-tRNA-protein transferase